MSILARLAQLQGITIDGIAPPRRTPAPTPVTREAPQDPTIETISRVITESEA